MNEAAVIWSPPRDDSVQTILSPGFPEEPGVAIAKSVMTHNENENKY